MGLSVSTAAVTLLSNGELDTLALRQGDPGLILANDENVALTGGKVLSMASLMWTMLKPPS